MLDFFDTYLKTDKEVNKTSSFKHKKIWNLSLKKWDLIEEDKFHYYKFGLESNGTANVEIIDGSLLFNSIGSGWFSIVHDPWRPCQGDGGHLGPNPGLFNRYIFDKRLDVGVFQTNSFEEDLQLSGIPLLETSVTVSYTHLRAHETTCHRVCRLLLEMASTDHEQLKTSPILLNSKGDSHQ